MTESARKKTDTPKKSTVVRPPATIRVRTLVLGILILISVFVLSFASVFLYQYLKPKYGSVIIKTTPPGALIYVDGNPRGTTPLTLSNMHSREYLLKGTREGYREFAQNLYIIPFTTQNLHWDLEPLISQLTNAQLAEIEALQRKLESAQKENILLPPPEDYNVLYFSDRILTIDPTNEYALDAKMQLAENLRDLAELAFSDEKWLEAEKLYKHLSRLLQYDLATENRLADIAARIDENIKDREKQVEEWKIIAENSIEEGRFLPPDQDNALDAVQNIQRLDKDNIYVRETIARLKELLQNLGDSHFAASDWLGARKVFKSILEYFPEDIYSRARLASVDDVIAKLDGTRQQPPRDEDEHQQFQQNLTALRRAGLSSFQKGSYSNSIAEWEQVISLTPDNDDAYFYLAASYQGEKQMDNAIFYYEKCLAINPDHASAHLNLGMLYDYHRKDLQAAGQHLKKAMELGGSSQYDPDRIQAMIQDLEDRAKAMTVLKTLFPAEHMHMLSSCRGNLRFSEEGVEYITKETDHSFYERYRELRILSLQGNKLTVKTRSKTYNLHFLNNKDAERVKTWGVASQVIQ